MIPTDGWNTLVEVPALAAALDAPQLRIIDARFAPATVVDPDFGRRAYAESHLPGSVYADLNRELSDLSRPGLGRHPLPDDAAFAATLGRWGVTPASQVVVYDAGDGSMAAARLWWMLRLMGHRRAAVLNGGLQAWREAGLAETDVRPPPADAGPYPARLDRAAIVGSDEVLARLGEPAGWLLDARAGERFRGEVEPIDAVAGHVPGAVNRPLGLSLENGRWLPPQRLRAGIEPLLGGHRPSDVVLMCGSGVTACHLLLAMEAAGLHGARVYAASWSGWIDDPSRPVATAASE